MEEAVYIPELVEGWEGKGYCKARHIMAENDWCNKPVVKGGEYCRECTCTVPKCKEKWSTLFPLLPGGPRFCSKHYRTDRFKYGCE